VQALEVGDIHFQKSSMHDHQGNRLKVLPGTISLTEFLQQLRKSGDALHGGHMQAFLGCVDVFQSWADGN
jgi:hypothetical protein